jgi:hypothetical protein
MNRKKKRKTSYAKFMIRLRMNITRFVFFFFGNTCKNAIRPNIIVIGKNAIPTTVNTSIPTGAVDTNVIMKIMTVGHHGVVNPIQNNPNKRNWAFLSLKYFDMIIAPVIIEIITNIKVKIP